MRQIAALLCLILWTLTSTLRAQTQIHRCIGANGGAVFTDQVCAALQATPVTAVAPQSSVSAISTPLPTLCSNTIDALRQSVIAAFAARNANRLAGLMLWDGYGRGAVIADIRSLNELMKQPLVDVDFAAADASAGRTTVTPDMGGMSADPFAAQEAAAPPAAAAANNELVLHTAGNAASNDANERRFRIVRRAGCLWLRRSY